MLYNVCMMRVESTPLTGQHQQRFGFMTVALPKKAVDSCRDRPVALGPQHQALYCMTEHS